MPGERRWIDQWSDRGSDEGHNNKSTSELLAAVSFEAAVVAQGEVGFSSRMLVDSAAGPLRSAAILTWLYTVSAHQSEMRGTSRPFASAGV